MSSNNFANKEQQRITDLNYLIGALIKAAAVRNEEWDKCLTESIRNSQVNFNNNPKDIGFYMRCKNDIGCKFILDSCKRTKDFKDAQKTVKDLKRQVKKLSNKL